MKLLNPCRPVPGRAGVFRVTAILIVLMAILTQAPAAEKPELKLREEGFPAIRLTTRLRGLRAVRALGVQMPAVARAYGCTATELRIRLLSDSSLVLDQRGRLHYTCAALPASAGVEPAGAPPVSAVGPLTNTFLLHSKPGAPKVIYLDFNGHVLTNTAWNLYAIGQPAVINAPPWDIDGDPSTFNDTERTTIQQIWQRVSEDYSPFDVDVTTEDPGESAITRSDLSDFQFGTRVLISPISGYFGYYGGIAYVGVFDMTTNYYKPALVFPENLANADKYIGEACTHEAGHNLGLFHDGTTSGVEYFDGFGTGETGWAPIMGNGYYRNLTQWSKGEYQGANNFQDDFAVMSAYSLLIRLDDHGNTRANATILPDGATLSASGIIESENDVDFFRFSVGAGPATLNIAPNSLGPNLDILASLYDANGVLIATNNPAAQLAAAFSLNLGAGTYYLSVASTGFGSPLTNGYSKYATRGQYTLTGTVTPPASANQPPTASFTATPSSGQTPLPVSFNATASSDPDGSIANWSWNFGDGGTATGATVSHTFLTAGNFSVFLTVTDNQGAIGTTSKTISVTLPPSPPEASFTATPISGTAPLTVQFNGSDSYDADGFVQTYAWKFGDGTTGTGITTSHTYTSAGTYNATLTVTDNQGLTNAVSATISVSPPNQPPVPILAASATVGPNPMTVTLSGSGSTDPDGSIIAYEWDFGDGLTGTGAVVDHTYFSLGTYKPKLIVTDNQGVQRVTNATIQVLSPAAFVIRTESITLTKQHAPASQWTLSAVVKVTNLLDQPVQNVLVTGRFGGLSARTRTGATAADGTVELVSPVFDGPGTETFRVISLSRDGYTFDSTRNLETIAEMGF